MSGDPLGESPSALRLSHREINQLSPIALAYIGDAVFELYIRTQYLWPPQRPAAFHQQVVNQVRAESQAQFFTILEPDLTAEELEIFRRGRNASTSVPRRLERQVYQQATGFEALLGYLYLTDSERLNQLLAQLHSLIST